eukprot:6130210-Lingulodinium_polyedra.AAC.1
MRVARARARGARARELCSVEAPQRAFEYISAEVAPEQHRSSAEAAPDQRPTSTQQSMRWSARRR